MFELIYIKVLKISLIILALFVLLFLGMYTYYGGLKKVNFTISERNPELLAYEAVVGDYSRTPEISNRVYSVLLDEFGIETYRGFGIFYDNPKNVEKDKMRSEIGCILENQPDSILFSQIETKLKLKIQSGGKYLEAEFPYKGAVSIMLGIMKVYPALARYSKENNIADAENEAY